MTNTVLRNKLYDFIKVADEKKLKAIYTLLQEEIDQVNEWWNNESYVAELDARYEALDSGKDKGKSIADVNKAIGKLREKKYGK